MKKILFLLLSVAVASSAFAGVKVNQVQKSVLPQASKITKVSNAPAVTKVNVQTMNINAPRVQAPQRQALPIEGLSWLENSVNPSQRAVVTEQPAGEVKSYIRSGKANYCDDSSVYTGDQSGTVTVVVDGDTYWFKNLFYDPLGNFDVNYWIQGTKSGNVITVSLPQDVDATTYTGYTVQMAWGTTRISGSSIAFTKSSNAAAYFDIDSNGVLTLRNATYSSSYAGNGLHAYVSASGTNYYQYMSLFTTTLTPAENVPQIITYSDIQSMTGELVAYDRYGMSLVPIIEGNYITGLDIAEQNGSTYIFYDEDGETVYMYNPIYGFLSGAWVKGTKSGDKLTFPLGQYLIYWEDDDFAVKTCWGTFTDYQGFTADPSVTEVTYTITDEYIVLDNAGLEQVNDTTYSFTGLATMLDSARVDLRWYYRLDFTSALFLEAGTPTLVNVEAGVTTANVSWTAGEHNATWNVRYREPVDPSTVDFFYCEFEEADTTTLYEMWGMDADGDGNWWEWTQGQDGNLYFTSASYINDVGALTPDNWLVTPEITLDGVVRLTAWGQDASWAAEVFNVYYFVGDTATIEDFATSFVALGEDVTTTGEKTEYTFAIPDAVKGQKGYIAIRHYNVTDMFMLNIDDLYVGDPDGGSHWIYVYDVEDPATVLSGLTPETTYEVQVQGVNGGGGVSAWTESVLFTTLADQPQPTVLRGDVDDSKDVGMDDLTVLINYLLTNDASLINYDNAAICDALTGDESEIVSMDDLTALINYLLTGNWPD